MKWAKQIRLRGSTGYVVSRPTAQRLTVIILYVMAFQAKSRDEIRVIGLDRTLCY